MKNGPLARFFCPFEGGCLFNTPFECKMNGQKKSLNLHLRYLNRSL